MIIANIISALLLPPLNFVLLCVVGLVLRRLWPRLGLAVSLAALALLVIFSTVAGSQLLLRPLESFTKPLASNQATQAQAIVVLGGGRIAAAPEYAGQDRPGLHALARLHYAARLQRQTGLPLLVTGGAPDGALDAEAALMARVLTDELAVPVKWLESHSNTTAENAALSAQMLQTAGITRILLVTDAMHMPRSKSIFEQNGFEVFAAPTLFFGKEPLTAFSFIPGGEGLQRSHAAMHEWIGLWWYRVRY